VDRQPRGFKQRIAAKKFHVWRELIAPRARYSFFAFCESGERLVILAFCESGERLVMRSCCPIFALMSGPSFATGIYGEIVNQGVPDRFVEILRGLDGPDDEGSQNGSS
jgi:hypothetical protein